jgi:hypothetical protein
MGINGNGSDSEPLRRIDQTTLRNCTAFPRNLLRERKIWPNDIKFHKASGTGILVVPRAKNWDEFAMSEAGLSISTRRCRTAKFGMATWRWLTVVKSLLTTDRLLR